MPLYYGVKPPEADESQEIIQFNYDHLNAIQEKGESLSGMIDAELEGLKGIYTVKDLDRRDLRIRMVEAVRAIVHLNILISRITEEGYQNEE